MAHLTKIHEAGEVHSCEESIFTAVQNAGLHHLVDDAPDLHDSGKRREPVRALMHTMNAEHKPAAKQC